MTPLNVVKIDLCGSKAFAKSHQEENPGIRSAALRKLVEIATRSFPGGDARYPAGSFYKADGDAVLYIIDKSSIALRGAIEFMQGWFHEALKEYPECKVFIDRGPIETVDVPGPVELVGPPFENISVIEKSVDEGRIYVSEAVRDNCDKTMAKFSFYGNFTPRPSEHFRTYYVNFLDPRTVDDTSLVHALFVAHKKADEARVRLFELFSIEYLLKFRQISDIDDLIKWANGMNYPMPDRKKLEGILNRSELLHKVQVQGQEGYAIKDQALATITQGQEEFRKAREECIHDVQTSINASAKSEAASSGVDLGRLVEDYLCAVFSEIRMIANFFRDTCQLFENDPQAFRRFEYILKRHLSDLPPQYFGEWRDGFLRGLKVSSGKNNLFIAAIFHNVLATYYLNRSSQTSPYQAAKLLKRQIFLDTNVLYSLLVPASSFHEITKHFADRLLKIGLRFRVFPFTLEEYESSLADVEKQYRGGAPTESLLRRNPWLLQEFKSDPNKYLGSISVCRSQFSIAKKRRVEEKDFDELRAKLSEKGLDLDTSGKNYSEKEAEELWLEIRSMMDRPKWDLGQYWDFIYDQDSKPEELIRHDVSCIQNVDDRFHLLKSDELGPMVMFLTTDSKKLLRLRKKYPFILSPFQFMEFILPYLFLSDIPLEEADKFPNQLLSAQLGTLLVRKPPEITDLIAGYLRHPQVLSSEMQASVQGGAELATLLSQERFEGVIKLATGLDDAASTEIAKETAKIVDDLAAANRDTFYKSREAVAQIATLKAQVQEKDQKLEKLQKTVRYWRERSRRV